MAENIELGVTYCQELTVPMASGTIGSMSNPAETAELLRRRFAARLNEALDKIGFPEKNSGRQTALARAMSVRRGGSISQKGVRKWLEGEALPSEENRQILVQLCGIAYQDLFGSLGSSNPLHSQDVSGFRFDQNTQQVIGPARQVPLISNVAAGKLTEVCNPYALGAYERMVMVHEDVSGRAFALRIVGDSMLPEFREGDIIVVDPNVTPQPGDYVVAKNHSEEATFKRYRPRGKNESGQDYFELIPLNPDFPTLRSDFDHLVIIGVEVEHHSLRRNRRK